MCSTEYRIGIYFGLTNNKMECICFQLFKVKSWMEETKGFFSKTEYYRHIDFCFDKLSNLANAWYGHLY